MAQVKVRTLRRLIVVGLLLVLAPVTHAETTCAGWSTSAAERIACCKRADAGCPSMSSDACCAEAEQRQNLQVAGMILVTPGALVSLPLPAITAVHWHQIAPQSSAIFDGRRTHLLDSVFLI